jgi:hypothetical protein
MTGLAWSAVICGAVICGPLFGHLVWVLLTGPKPSAAEVAAAEMAATPEHPAGKQREPFDIDEWERRYAASQTADRMRKW